MSSQLLKAYLTIPEFASPYDFTGINNLGIYTRDTVQRHALGRKYMTWDGKLYKYCQAKGTLDPDFGAKCYATQNLATAAIVLAQSAGDRQLSCTFGAADGYTNAGLVAENELAGGKIVVYSNTVATMRRTIVGNSAVATGGGTGIIYVEQPWNVAIATADSTCEAMGSEYFDTRDDTDGTKCVICVPTVPAVSGEFYWGQTWGPCWVSPQSGVGATTMIRGVYWRHDGSVDIRALAGSFHDAYVTDQYAGFVLQNAQAGTQGAPFFMMQITPI